MTPIDADVSARFAAIDLAIDEGRRIVLPLAATVAAQGAALADIRDDVREIRDQVREDMREIRELLERRATPDRPAYSLARAICAPIASACRVIATNEHGQLRWFALAIVAVAAILWGVPVALDWSGVVVGP